MSNFITCPRKVNKDSCTKKAKSLKINFAFVGKFKSGSCQLCSTAAVKRSYPRGQLMENFPFIVRKRKQKAHIYRNKSYLTFMLNSIKLFKSWRRIKFARLVACHFNFILKLFCRIAQRAVEDDVECLMKMP